MMVLAGSISGFGHRLKQDTEENIRLSGNIAPHMEINDGGLKTRVSDCVDD